MKFTDIEWSSNLLHDDSNTATHSLIGNACVNIDIDVVANFIIRGGVELSRSLRPKFYQGFPPMGEFVPLPREKNC